MYFILFSSVNVIDKKYDENYLSMKLRLAQKCVNGKVPIVVTHDTCIYGWKLVIIICVKEVIKNINEDLWNIYILIPQTDYLQKKRKPGQLFNLQFEVDINGTTDM